jgi:D-alanine-D-alanine ligase
MSPSTFLFAQAAEVGMSHTDLINLLIDNELQGYGLATADNFSGERAEMNAPHDKKTRVAVIFGGDSNEREVSLESGRNTCYKLSPQKYDILPFFLNDEMELFLLPQNILIKNSTKAITSLVTSEMKIEWSDLPAHADFIFLALHGGKGENGSVQGALEMLNLPYNGSGVLASALCMDKFKTNNFLRTKGFVVPHAALLAKTTWLKLSSEEKSSFITNFLTSNNLSLPLIVKPHNDGCSVMVSKAGTIEDMISSLDAFFTTTKEHVLIEEMINGVELTVGVIGNDNPQAMPPSLAVIKGDILTQEEKFLPGAGENQTPAPLPAPALALIQQTVRDAFVAIGCKGYARIDCFYQEAATSPTKAARVVLLEFNTLPALTPATCLFHQAAELGIKPMDFFDQVIQLGFQLHQKTIAATAMQTTLMQPAAVAAEHELAVDEAVFKPIPEEALKPEPVTEEESTTKKPPKTDDSVSLQAPADESFTMSLF